MERLAGEDRSGGVVGHCSPEAPIHRAQIVAQEGRHDGAPSEIAVDVDLRRLPFALVVDVVVEMPGDRQEQQVHLERAHPVEYSIVGDVATDQESDPSQTGPGDGNIVSMALNRRIDAARMPRGADPSVDEEQTTVRAKEEG